MTITIHEGWRAGAIGRIAELHAVQYAASNGFGVGVEAKVARELGDFCQSFESDRDGLSTSAANNAERSSAGS